MTENSQSRALVLTEEQQQQLVVARECAQLWQAKWTTLEKVKPAELHRIAMVIQSSFPEMGAFEITNYFDMLGGKLRPNAEFWQHVAAQHPMCEYTKLERIHPDTPEWEEYLGKETGEDVIACAYVGIVARKDRSRETRECNYVKKDDPILCDYEYFDLKAKTRADALKEAEALGVEPGGWMRFDRNSQVWSTRKNNLKSDWLPLAMKKCRTTTMRRVCSKTFSLVEARVLAVQANASSIIEMQSMEYSGDRQKVDAGDGLQLEAPATGKMIAAPPEEPYADPDPPGEPVDSDVDPEHEDDHLAEDIEDMRQNATEPESIEDSPTEEPEEHAPLVDPNVAPDKDLEPRYLDETDRRKLFVWANERDMGAANKDELLIALKKVIAYVQEKTVEEVSTKTVTYAELAMIREELEQYPHKDAKQPAEEIEPETQGDLL